MSVLQIPSNPTIDELIDNLSQLDTPTLNYLVTSLSQVQRERESVTMMKEAEFWNLLTKINWRKENDKAKSQTLATYSTAKIFQFSERLAFLLHQLDSPEFTKILKQTDLGFSADTFLYARCFVVAKGKRFYEAVHKQPLKMPTDGYFERLLYVAEDAYQLKTNQTYSYIPSTNYESFFNQELWGDKAITF